MIMLSNHSQLRAVWTSPYINIILEVSYLVYTPMLYNISPLQAHENTQQEVGKLVCCTDEGREKPNKHIVKQTWWDIEWLTGTPAIDGGAVAWWSSVNQQKYGTNSAPATANMIRWHHPWISKRLGDSTNRLTMYPVYCPLTLGKAFTDQCCCTAFVRHSECCWFFMSLGIRLHRMQMHHWVCASSILYISTDVEVTNPAFVTPPKHRKTLQGPEHSWPVFWWPGHQVVALFPVFQNKSTGKERL